MRKVRTATFVPLYFVYLALFLFSFQFGVTLYINSSFLKTFFSEGFVGFVYIAASLATLFGLAYLPKVLRVLGNYNTTLALLGLEFFALLAIAIWPDSPAVIPLFITYQALITLSLFNIDVFMEHYSTERMTGVLRGVMLTVLNLAILLGPFVAGLVLTNGDFWRVYLLASFFILPAWWIIAHYLKDFKDPEYSGISLFKTLKKTLLAKHPNDNIRHAFVANFLMRFFYSWMVIYTPIYLHDYIGFSWSEIGIILTIMLLPLVFFEIPVGRYADRRFAEKEIMIGGFFIATLFTAVLAIPAEPSLLLWAALLFGGRIGISFIEVTSESYFFKHVKDADTNVISIFRDTRPLAYILGPLSASILLFFVELQTLFFVLAGVMSLGIINTLLMRGTRSAFEQKTTNEMPQ